jgi:hypothetical protein
MDGHGWGGGEGAAPEGRAVFPVAGWMLVLCPQRARTPAHTHPVHTLPCRMPHVWAQARKKRPHAEVALGHKPGMLRHCPAPFQGAHAVSRGALLWRTAAWPATLGLRGPAQAPAQVRDQVGRQAGAQGLCDGTKARWHDARPAHDHCVGCLCTYGRRQRAPPATCPYRTRACPPHAAASKKPHSACRPGRAPDPNPSQTSPRRAHARCRPLPSPPPAPPTIPTSVPHGHR